MEAYGADPDFTVIHKILPSVLSVSVPAWSHLRLVQPFQSGTDSLGTGHLYPLYGMQEGLSC